jgi:eukaryotic-like serine/threonine-protein kinase
VIIQVSDPTEPWPLGALPSGRLLFGKYRVERLLGTGGMGAVYAAEHLLTRRKGALKLLHARYTAHPEVVERFVREAAAAGLIGNPHIVDTFDAGTLESGEPYIFMELLEGQALDATIAERAPLPWEEAVAIAAQAADALGAAHRAGIVHRDIKPANMFVTDGNFVKVIDFGISKFVSELDPDGGALTREGALLGTPLYMSPEQVMGHRDLDGRADIYALGAALFEMLTGKAPFFGDSLMQLSVRICAGDCTPLRALRPELPAEVEAVVRRAMAPARENRFARAEDFAEALRDLAPRLSGERAVVPRFMSNPPIAPGPPVAPGTPIAPGPPIAPGTPIAELQTWPASADADTAATLHASEEHSDSPAAPAHAPETRTIRSGGTGQRWLLGLAGVALALGVAWALLSRANPSPADGADAPPAPKLEAHAPPTATFAEGPPTVPDEAPESSPAVSTAPLSAGSGAQPSTRPRSSEARKAAAAPSSNDSTAADRDGLSVDNPFAQ